MIEAILYCEFDNAKGSMIMFQYPRMKIALSYILMTQKKEMIIEKTIVYIYWLRFRAFRIEQCNITSLRSVIIKTSRVDIARPRLDHNSKVGPLLIICRGVKPETNMEMSRMKVYVFHLFSFTRFSRITVTVRRWTCVVHNMGE